MNIFSIKDLEQLSGIKAHTIRIWEQRYSFINPSRTGTNIRYYSNDELKIILNISLLNRYGYKVSRINKMTAEQINENLLKLTHIDAQKERIVNGLIQYMINLQIENFETALDEYIREKGLEKTILEIVFPFLEKVGLLWQTNHINPAQEHLVSNVIRQKIVVGIDKTNTRIDNRITVMMFLPEGEHHELSLLFVHYLLKIRGLKVLYLGSNMPLKDILYTVEIINPAHLYCHLTSIPNNFKIEKYFSKISGKLNESKLVVSGDVIQGYKGSVPPNINLKKSLPEVLDFFKTV